MACIVNGAVGRLRAVVDPRPGVAQEDGEVEGLAAAGHLEQHVVDEAAVERRVVDQVQQYLQPRHRPVAAADIGEMDGFGSPACG